MRLTSALLFILLTSSFVMAEDKPTSQLLPGEPVDCAHKTGVHLRRCLEEKGRFDKLTGEERERTKLKHRVAECERRLDLLESQLRALDTRER